MYDKRAKQDALDLWFSMPGEMSVDDFAAELGYPSGSTLRNWIKADPRHDPDKCQYRSKPVLPKLEAIRRVAEGATAAQAARETGLTPQQVRYSVGRYARGGTAALLPAPARKRRKGEAVDEGKTRRARPPSAMAVPRPLGPCGGAAGRESTVNRASASSAPPGARGSGRSKPETETAHSARTPSGRRGQTHWISPSRVRRVRKVTPPRSRRACTIPCRVTARLFRPTTAASNFVARTSMPITPFCKKE